MKRLTVALDELATLRYVLNDSDFDPVQFAVLCEVAGAHGISFMLTDAPGSIQERDALLFKKLHKSFLNIRIPPETASIKAALTINPDMVTFVGTGKSGAQKISPLSSEVLKDVLTGILPDFHANNISVAVYSYPDINILKQIGRMRVDYVEFDCTEMTLAGDSNEELVAMDKLHSATLAAVKLGMGVNCFGGIRYDHLPGLAAIPRLEDICMGISLLKRAFLVGVNQAVREALQQILFYQREQ